MQNSQSRSDHRSGRDFTEIQFYRLALHFFPVCTDILLIRTLSFLGMCAVVRCYVCKNVWVQNGILSPYASDMDICFDRHGHLPDLNNGSFSLEYITPVSGWTMTTEISKTVHTMRNIPDQNKH